MRTLGIILLVAGIIMMAVSGFNFKTEKKVLDVGPLEVSKEQNHHVGWPVWVGGAAPCRHSNGCGWPQKIEGRYCSLSRALAATPVSPTLTFRSSCISRLRKKFRPVRITAIAPSLPISCQLGATAVERISAPS